MYTHGGGSDAICSESCCLAVKADYGVFTRNGFTWQLTFLLLIQFLVCFLIYRIHHKDVLKQTAVCRCVSSPVGVSRTVSQQAGNSTSDLRMSCDIVSIIPTCFALLMKGIQFMYVVLPVFESLLLCILSRQALLHGIFEISLPDQTVSKPASGIVCQNGIFGSLNTG